MINTIAQDKLDRKEEYIQLKVDLTNTMDMNSNQAVIKFKKVLEKNNSHIITLMNKLDNSLRIKMKYLLDQLKLMIVRGSQTKQNINFTIKKDE